MGDSPMQFSLNLLRDLSNGTVGHEISILSSKGLRVVEARKGFFLCNFTVHDRVTDKNGNWRVGAIASLIDIIGTCAVHTFVSVYNVSVDFTLSFFSTAKAQEEVEIEAKVLGRKERLTYVVVEVRKKANAELIALSKQWMATSKGTYQGYHQSSKL